MSRERRREMVDREHPGLSTVRQCALLGVSRSSVYYRPRAPSQKELALMKQIDQQYLAQRLIQDLDARPSTRVDLHATQQIGIDLVPRPRFAGPAQTLDPLPVHRLTLPAQPMKVWLGRQGHWVNRKRVQRLMRTLGLQVIYRRPRTSKPAPGHKVYPYLLGGMEITGPNQVWAADITYIPGCSPICCSLLRLENARSELSANFIRRC